MIPLYDVIPSRTTPVVTVGLIAVNVLVFLFEVSLGDSVDLFLHTYGLIPAEFSLPTLATSMFLHGGFSHVGGNMLFLWIFGDNVEDRMGHLRFLLFYLLCGTAAALAQTLMQPDSLIADGGRQRRRGGGDGRLLRALSSVPDRHLRLCSRSSRYRPSSFSDCGSSCSS